MSTPSSINPLPALVAISVAAIFLSKAVVSQEKGEGDVTATVEVTLLSLDVLALDRKDKPVLDLKAEDLEVKVGGRVQPIEFFEPPPPPTGSGAAPPRVAGTTLPLEGIPRVASHLVFYLDREGLSRDGLLAAVKAIGESLDRLSAGERVSVVAHFGLPSRLVWEEVSIGRIQSELDRLADQGAEDDSGPSFHAGGQTDGQSVRSWEGRRRREAQLVTDYQRAESPQLRAFAMQAVTDYVRTERLRANEALEALRSTCKLLAELDGRKQVVLISEGFEKEPGSNFLRYLMSAASGDSMSNERESMSMPSRGGNLLLLAGRLSGLDDFEKWLAASGVRLHFVNAVPRLGLPTAEYAVQRNERAEKFSLEVGPSTLTERSGGMMVNVAGSLPPMVEVSGVSYRVGVRVTGFDVGKPYKVAVTSKRKGVSVRHQSSYLKAPGTRTVAAAEVVQAGRAEADARRDEKREGAIRLSLAPIPVKIEWQGKMRPDPKQAGRNLYRVEITLPYDDLKFSVAGDGLIANARLSVTAVGIAGTAGQDEASVDESPSFSGEEYRDARGKNLVRAFLLSLPPGKYRLDAAASDQLEARAGTAQLEVVAAP